MPNIMQVRLAGLGGQGVILAGLLLGQAGVFDGRSVSGSNFYGAQARGSGCKSEIAFSDGPIDFPHLVTADILVAMSQGAYDSLSDDVREETGLILYDHGWVTPKERAGVRQVGIPATEVSVKRLKSKQAANIVLLGAFVEITKMVSPGAVRKAIRLHVSEKFQGLNLKALQVGMELGRQVHG
jgi:2-oxoglutarate ferredoxin oxidoreductase subunit gamma